MRLPIWWGSIQIKLLMITRFWFDLCYVIYVMEMYLNMLYKGFKCQFNFCFYRHLRDFVSWLSSEPMWIYYIDSFKHSMWPKGKLAPYPPPRTDLVNLSWAFILFCLQIHVTIRRSCNVFSFEKFWIKLKIRLVSNWIFHSTHVPKKQRFAYRP